MIDDGSDDLADAFETLEPGATVRARMEREVLSAHAIAQRSLAAEWLELVRGAPVGGTLLLAAAAAVLLIATPIGVLLALVSGLT